MIARRAIFSLHLFDFAELISIDEVFADAEIQ